MSVQTDPLSDSIGVLTGSRYDWLLVAIPIPLVLGWAVSATLPVASAVGLGFGAIPAMLLVCYGLFVDAPVVGSGEPDAEPERAPGSFDGTTGSSPTNSVPGSDD